MSRSPSPHWDAVVVGAGPAGLAAGLQLARGGWRTAILERGRIGGQAGRLERIENLPGLPRPIPGRRLMSAWLEQAVSWGAKTLRGELRGLRGTERGNRILLSDGKTLEASVVILATGARFKKLRAPGADDFSGRGVYHAPLDHAARWRGRRVAVVGGGEAAVHQAVHLAEHGAMVYLVARGPLRAHPLLISRLAAQPRVCVIRARVSRVEGRRAVTGLALRGRGCPARIAVSAVFVLIGARASEWAARARRKGVFLAGDAKGGIERQVAVAAGDGTAAAVRAMRVLGQRP